MGGKRSRAETERAGGKAPTLPHAALSLVVLLITVVVPFPAQATHSDAQLHTMTFDDRAPGTIVTSGVGGVTFPQNPVVFSVPDAATQSAPHALRRAGNCPNSGPSCTTGDNTLRIDFADPARIVTMRVGVVVPHTCFELDCPFVRLVGFDSSGKVVAATPPKTVTSQSITVPFSIDAGSHLISGAVLGVAEDPESGASLGGYEYTAQIDDLSYEVAASGGPPDGEPPLAAPSIEITSPSDGASFATTDVPVSGRVSAAAEVAGFCAAVDTIDMPSPCANTGFVRPDESDGNVDGSSDFSIPWVAGTHPGTNRIKVWIQDTRGRVDSDSVTVEVAGGDVDLAVETMEVTQVVQTEDLPEIVGPNPPTITVPGLGRVEAATYDGVPLAQDKLTIVRVFASARGADSPLEGVPALLHGYSRDGGRLVELPRSPIVPHGDAQPLVDRPDLARLRASQDGAFNFLLPSGWTRPAGGELVLAAEVAPGSLAPALRAAECCESNNVFGLTGIRFTEERRIRMYPVALRYTDLGDGTTIAPTDRLELYFSEMRMVMPAPMDILTPLASVDVTDIMDPDFGDDGFDRLDAIVARLEEAYGDLDLNGRTLGLLGESSSLTSGIGPGPFGATGNIDLELDFIAHEAGHQLGEAHAHDGDEDPLDCDDGDDGTIQGVGIDPRPWSGGAVGQFKLIGAEKPGVFDADPDAAPMVFDYMSYCSDETADPTKTWISAPYWAMLVRELRPGGRVITDSSEGCCFLGGAADPTARRSDAESAPAASVRPGQTTMNALRVSALLPPEGGAAFTRVEPSEEPFSTVAPESDVEVVVRSETGAEVSRTRVSTTVMHARPGPGEEERDPSRFLSAVVPGNGAARVDLVVAGRTVASRLASATPPTVKLRSPKRGTRIGGSNFTVRWEASDPDADALSARVEFSADHGLSWEVLDLAIEGQRTTLHGSALPRAGNGILRVVVNDGFHSDTSTVKRIRATGTKPQVLITSPQEKITLDSDTLMTFVGRAHDDEGTPLRGKRLTWTSGKRKLGRGENIDVPAYALEGNITLTATDRFGRIARATLKVEVRRASPGFTMLKGKVAKKVLKLRAASTIPAKVTITGAGVRKTVAAVGIEPRTLRVNLTSRRDSYKVQIRLAAGGKTIKRTLLVKRG